MSAVEVHRRTTTTTDDDDDATALDVELEDRLSALLASPSSDSSFSVARYLNLALSSTTTNPTDENYGDTTTDDEGKHQQQHLEQRMASLALQLQMHTQSCHDEIGRIGAELTAIVPRCAADVERIHVGLDGIESDVVALLHGMDDTRTDEGRVKEEGGPNSRMLLQTTTTGADVGGGVGISNDKSSNAANNISNNNNNATTTGDDTTIHPLATLHTLLNLRTHLTSARSILSAAASWDETINSIPMLLSTSPPNLIEAVAALSQLEDGARALAGMPEGKDDRSAAIGKLRSQLEVLLKPQLLHALKKMDTRLGPLVQCVSMYNSLGKMDVIREEYVKIRPVEVHALWFSFVGGAVAGAAGTAGGGKKEDNYDDKKGRNTALASTGDGEEEVVEDFDFGDDVDGGIASSTMTVSTTITTTTTTARQFVDFLPKFYDATLELLTKERAQCKQIFGTELAPSIVVRVLIECFRPIVTSFAKRLGMLCPLPEQQRKGVIVEGVANSGGMEAIASVYESTVRFMALTYDTMEAWNVGGSSTIKTTTDTKTIGEEKEKVRIAIRSAYLLIASPFLPYQRALVESEQRPMSEAASMIAREVRGVMNFEDAAERLGDLAPYMFPLAESIMNRYELLNCGYNASSTLAAIDKIVANHAVELSITMGTLSTNALSSTGHEFEEQHVNCALEILRIAGLFKRNLLSFEHAVKDRFRALSVVMVDPGLDDVEFVPDELSPIQIRSMLAREACDPSPTYVDDGTGVKCPTSVLQLRRLVGGTNNENSTAVVPPLFPRSHDSTSRLARACLSLVFEVCSAIPERQLRGISALPIWKQDRGGVDGDEEESYGILPQQYITQVGEHMLALVQALEPFASNSEALELVNEVMNGVMEVAIQPWKEFVAATGCSFTGDGKSQVEMLMMGRDLSKFLLDDSTDDECGPSETKKNEDEMDDEDSALFCNKWLDVIGLALTGRLLERMMRIPRLGRRGSEHLATDLNYIMNVFTALGVPSHPHPLLKYITQLVMMDDQMLRSKIQLHRGETSEVVEVVKRAELRIAHVRGISV
jgi:hypothetical protein